MSGVAAQWRDAPMAAAVAQVVESLAPEQIGKRRADRGKRILVASYAEDFDYLWAYSNDLTEWLEPDRHIILVWDGTRKSGRLGQYNVTEYLTPADWSVMMTSAAKQVPRISIIDFSSYRHQNSRSLQTFRHLLRTNPSPLAHVNEVNLSCLKQFFSAVSTDNPAIQPGSEDRSMLRALWTSLLGEGKGSHHAVANIVGPLLLLEAMQRSARTDGSPIPAALRQLVRVLREPDQKSTGQTGREPEGKAWFDFKRNLGQSADLVVLIDDLGENGWGDVLRAVLGLDSGDPTLRVYLRPLAAGSGDKSTSLDLPDYLRRRLEWLRSDRRSAPPLLGADVKNPLLFLDIRLFSESSLEEERSFYKELLVLAREFATLPAPGWPLELSDRTLDPVEQFAEGKSDLESPDHHAALSLLPRLLALADPTLPIILFSSTGRRAIVEPLIPCGNVIFDFEKPSLAGSDWDEAIDRARIGFRRAMDRASVLLRARSFLQELRDDAYRLEPLLKKASLEKCALVEVYIDESGTTTFSVGGIVVLYPSHEAREKLDQALKDFELVWGLAEGHPPLYAGDATPEPEHRIPKYPGNRPGRYEPAAYNEFLNRLNERFEALDIDMAGFSLVWKPDDAAIAQDLPVPLREDVIDNRYRRMIEEVLEAVLYCLLPAYGAADAHVSVDCGTRVQSVLFSPYEAERLKSDFGILSNLRTTMYYVLSSDSVYPIVARLLASRPAVPPKIQRARGTSLYDYDDLDLKNGEEYQRIVNDQSRPRPQQIHYLADWFARFGLHYPRIPDADIVAKAFGGGFLDGRDERFAGWLRASRAGAEKRLTDALAEVWMATRHKEPKWSVSRWLRRRAADWGLMVDGPGFLELAFRIGAKSAQDMLGSKQNREDSVCDTTQSGPANEKAESLPSISAQLFERLVPGASSGQVQLKGVAIEGSRAMIAVAGKDALTSTLRAIKQVARELGVKEVDVIEWSADPAVVAKRALKRLNSAKIATNDEGRIELRVPPWNLLTADQTKLISLASSLIGREILIVSATSGQTN